MVRPGLLLLLTACSNRTMSWGEAELSTPREPVSDRQEVDAIVQVVAVGCSDAVGEGAFVRKQSASPMSSEGNWLWGGGVITGDLLSDTLNDLVAPAEPFAKAYQGTVTGTFPEDSCLDPFDLAYGTGGSVADYDGDGLLDLLITRFSERTRLLRNNGDFTFSDVSDAVHLATEGPALASTWADFDRDGDLDLFIGNYAVVEDFSSRTDGHAAGSRLFVNNDGVTFTDRTDLLPPEVAEAWVTAATWVDIDRDLWPELYVVSDAGDYSGNVLVLNQLGTLVADGNRHGLDLILPANGLAVGDLDGDAIPDFILGERNNLRVLVSQTGYWREESAELGITLSEGQVDPWGLDLGDLDNDGDLDLVASFGATHAADPETAWDQPDAVFLRGDDGQFADWAAELGLADTGVMRGVVLSDLDNDGGLDIAKRDLEGPNLLYLSQCDPAQGWLRIQLSQHDRNTFAVGARVRIEVDGVWQTRTITAGGLGFGSGGPPEAHFGVGAATTIDTLEVTWPDGRTTTAHEVLSSAIVRIDRIP